MFLGQGFKFNGVSNVSEIYNVSQIKGLEILIDEVNFPTSRGLQLAHNYLEELDLLGVL
jgi:hypothetical protein